MTSGDASDKASRSYRPGDWFGIFGEQATVLLPPSEKSRVAGIWELVDEGAGFDEVLDALIASGLRELPGFVLVSEVDGETKVVIRGAARAVFTTDDETVTVEGSSATTWAERSLSGVRTMRIVVADERRGRLRHRQWFGAGRAHRPAGPRRRDHARRRPGGGGRRRLPRQERDGRRRPDVRSGRGCRVATGRRPADQPAAPRRPGRGAARAGAARARGCPSRRRPSQRRPSQRRPSQRRPSQRRPSRSCPSRRCPSRRHPSQRRQSRRCPSPR